MDIGKRLELDDSIERKIADCESVINKLLNEGWRFLPSIGKSICWLTYRHLEGKYSNIELLRQAFPKAFKVVSNEENQFYHYRWHCSLITARTYFMIFNDIEDKPKLLDGASLTINPFTMVNISRLCVLRAIWAIVNKDITDAQRAINRLFALWPRFAVMINLEGLPACGGYEIELVSRMIRCAVMLLPHAKMKYSGDMYPLEEIVKIEPINPYNLIAKKILNKQLTLT